jgi:hypothetical protein
MIVDRWSRRVFLGKLGKTGTTLVALFSLPRLAHAWAPCAGPYSGAPGTGADNASTCYINGGPRVSAGESCCPYIYDPRGN